MKSKYVVLAVWCFAIPCLAWDEVYGPVPPGDTCPTCPRSWTLRDDEGSWACRRVDNKPVCGPHQLNERARRALDAEIERANREFEKFTSKRKQDELEDRIERIENERR